MEECDIEWSNGLGVDVELMRCRLVAGGGSGVENIVLSVVLVDSDLFLFWPPWLILKQRYI